MSCLPVVDGIVYCKTKVEPRVDKGKLYKINPEFGLIADPEFEKTRDETDLPQECVGKYTSYTDPRTIDPRRGARYTFNRPPYQAMKTQMLDYKEIYGNIPTTKYDSYKSVGLGQYVYYLDTDISNPYYSPNYVIRSDVHTDVYNDPMSGRRVDYNRNPLTSTYKYLSDYQHTRDDLAFREDLMASQQRKYNEQRYSNFHT